MVTSVSFSTDATPAVDPNAAPLPTGTTTADRPADATPTAPVAGERPANVPEKFWRDGKVDTDALLASYGALETKLGAPKAPAAPVAPAADPKAPAADPATAAAEAAGVNLAGLSDEYAANNKTLSEATYADLAKKGFDKATVDQYIAGQEALAAQNQNTLFASAGVKDINEYSQITAWAATALKPAEIAAYNDTMNNGGLEKSKQALAGLVASYKNANGSDPKLITSDGTVSIGGDVYNSKNEMVTDMQDPRYKSDPAFQKKVADKLRRSSIF